MRPGDYAPNFTLPDQDTVPQQLSRLVGDGPVVLFFHHLVNRRCVFEFRRFEALEPAFERIGTQPVGISVRSVEAQRQLSEMFGLGFPLLSDVNGRVAAEYGVPRRFGRLRTKPQTFVVDSRRRIIAVLHDEPHAAGHAERALATLLTRR